MKKNIKKRLENITLSSYVIFSILIVLFYSIVEFLASTLTGISHDTLTTCFYACFGGEILSCALIKIFKLKEEKEDYKDE